MDSQSHTAAIDAVLRWLSNQSTEELLPRAAACELASSARQAIDFNSTAAAAVTLIEHAESRLKQENNSLKSFLGDETSSTLVDSASKVGNLIDDALIRDFLRSPAVEAIIGSLLYEALFEFVQRTDLIGSFVNGLPLLGPLRQQIVTALRKEVDTRLGSIIKRFMGSYASTSTERLTQLVLTVENRRALGDSTAKITADLLKRPLSSLVPPPTATSALKESILKSSPPPGTGDVMLIDTIYDSIGSEPLGQLLQGNKSAENGKDMQSENNGVLEEVPDLGPETRLALAEAWEKFIRSDEGQDALVHAAHALLVPARGQVRTGTKESDTAKMTRMQGRTSKVLLEE